MVAMVAISATPGQYTFEWRRVEAEEQWVLCRTHYPPKYVTLNGGG